MAGALKSDCLMTHRATARSAGAVSRRPRYCYVLNDFVRPVRALTLCPTFVPHFFGERNWPNQLKSNWHRNFGKVLNHIATLKFGAATQGGWGMGARATSGSELPRCASRDWWRIP